MEAARDRDAGARPGPRRAVHSFVPRALRPFTIRIGRILRELQHVAMNFVSRVNPRPVLVLGNQKSGTSAIAGLLARAAGKSVTLDLSREVWHPSFQRVPSGELSFDGFVARNRWGFSREIVKEPNLTLLYPELRQHFPDAPVLFVVRDPRDNIRSILNRLELAGDLAQLPPDAVDIEVNPLSRPGWRWVFDATWRGLPSGHYIDVLAQRWAFCAQVYLDNEDRMQLCRYEDFLADKIGTLERLAGPLGLGTGTDVTDVTEQLEYRFQSPGDNTHSWEDFFGTENLSRIEHACREGMQALGYGPLDRTR